MSLLSFGTHYRSVYDVSVKDNWPEEHFEVFGEESAVFPTIGAGDTASHSFIVQPKFEGYYTADRGVVSYKIAEDSVATIV